jgi:hypothetical protein
MIKKKYYLDIEKDIVKYGDEGFKYKPISDNKINHKINHTINKVKEKPKITKTDKHHIHDHFDKILDKITPNEEQKEKAKDGLNAVYANTISKPTHKDITLQERQYSFLNEASMKYSHGASQEEINNYLRDNGITKYKADFANSNNDALTFINKNNNKAVLAFRGSSLSKFAKKDWTSNAEILANPNLNTQAHQRVNEFFNNVSDIYDIEHITGYSRGGIFSTYLGNKYDIPSTSFNPFISPSIIKNFKKNNKSNHKIINTTEDIVSPLASILKLNNSNVNVKTVLPTDENASLIDPIGGHHNNNFTNENNSLRTTGRRYNLHNKIVRTGKKLGELDMVQKAKIIKENGGSFTDFLKRINPNDVNESRSLIDGSKTIEFSNRIKGAGIEAQIWNQIGGDMSRLELLKLNQNPQIEPVEFETTRLERIDHSNAPHHIKKQNIDLLENQLKDDINKLNTNISENVSENSKIGLKSIGSMVVGSAAGALVGTQQKQAGEFTSGAVTAALTGGKILTSGISSLGSAELGSSVSSLIEDKKTANIVDNAVSFGTLPIFEYGLGRLAGAAAVAVMPEIAAPVLLLTTLGSVKGAAENIIYK